MPNKRVKYFIHELTDGEPIFHGPQDSLKEAKEIVVMMKKSSRNNFVITPRFVRTESPQLSAPVQIMPEIIYAHVHGPKANLDDQPYSTKIIYRMLAEGGTKYLHGGGQSR